MALLTQTQVMAHLSQSTARTTVDRRGGHVEVAEHDADQAEVTDPQDTTDTRGRATTTRSVSLPLLNTLLPARPVLL